jgi:hypothetical protein
MGKSGTDPGDARGPGAYVPFVVLVNLGHSRLKHVPIQEVRIAARCYAATAQLADALAGAVSDAIHDAGYRTSGSGQVIFTSFDDGGEGATTDPDTKQPVSTVVISVGALTETIP